MKPKIAYVISRAVVGGPIGHLRTLTTGLAAEGFETLLVVGAPKPTEKSLDENLRQEGLPIVAIPEMQSDGLLSWRDLVAFVKLVQLFRSERPHVVSTHTAKAGLLGRLAAVVAGVPVVVHTFHGHVLHGYYNQALNVALRIMERGLAMISDRLIVIAPQLRDELLSYRIAQTKKFSLIRLGIDLAPFLNCSERKGRIRRRLGIPEEAPVVTIIGRIVPIKNHRLFIDSAKTVLNSVPEVHFLVVGDGELRQEVEEYGRRELGDRIHFVGWASDLPEIYADSNVVVISSDNEGTPVVVIEAMAAGCSVVATRVGGVPDMLSDGETGLLCEPGDSAQLASAMTRLCIQPAYSKKLSRNARRAAVSVFTRERFVKDAKTLMLDLLALKCPHVYAGGLEDGCAVHLTHVAS